MDSVAKENRRINILHLRDSQWVDGPGRTILETASAINIDRFGYYIGAFTRNDTSGNPYVEAARKRKVNVINIFESGTFDLKTIFQILKIIKNESIDILHTHEVRSDILGLLCGRISKIPVIVTLHGWIENDLRGRVLTGLDKNILKYFNHVIVVSNRMKNQVQEKGVNADKITVLHNALVLDNYKRDANDFLFRKQIGIDDDTLLIGNIGRLSPEKGQRDFIKAAAEVLKYYKKVKFVLIGSGKDEQNLRILTETLHIRDSVIFAGYRKDMLTVYNSLDLVVQSSYTEGMPNVVLEALAMEVPIIATDVGGTSEAIICNRTGILIQPGDISGISKMIIEYVKNPHYFRNNAKNGKDFVESKFSFAERTKKLSHIYETLFLQENDN